MNVRKIYDLCTTPIIVTTK